MKGTNFYLKLTEINIVDTQVNKFRSKRRKIPYSWLLTNDEVWIDPTVSSKWLIATFVRQIALLHGARGFLVFCCRRGITRGGGGGGGE